MNFLFYDAHCHYNFIKNKKYEGYLIAAVSLDYGTSLETLSYKDKNILRGIGIHPWRVHEENLNQVLQLIMEADFIGEVGLDFRYSIAPRELQIEYFKVFLESAPEKTFNVHALDAWEETFKILQEYNIKKAIFHWYTGPTHLLKDIQGAGYFITINPSVTFQKKHQAVAEKAEIDIILTESDGGYEYRGKLLEPIHVKEVINYLSKVKSIEEEELKKIIAKNFQKAFNISIPS
jgi:TatD DNase family protein